MLSITTAASHLRVSRDLLLDAVRSGRLHAARDRRGVLRISPDALAAFCASSGVAATAAPPAPRPSAAIIALDVMRPDRLAEVARQQQRLLRQIRPTP